MNFLIPRPNNQTVAREAQSGKETQVVANYVSKAATTLEGLIAEDPLPKSAYSETHNAESDEFGGENGSVASLNGRSYSQVDNHIDVTEDDGLLIIPYKKLNLEWDVASPPSFSTPRVQFPKTSLGRPSSVDLLFDKHPQWITVEEIPDNWTDAPDIHSFRSLDRSFVFPGEQIRMLACLSACKQDTEIITPFKVAAVMNKNGIRQSPKKQNGNNGGETNPIPQTVDASSADQDNQNGDIVMEGNIESQKDVPTGESLLRMEDHKRQTKQLLQRFKNSHFFARIAESNQPLWSKRRAQEACQESSEIFEEKLMGDSSETAATVKKKNPLSAAIDRGKFDAHTSGGMARGAVKCCSLSNGDIVVLLQVNVGVEFATDPILEILQFEKYQERNQTLENQNIPEYRDQDPSGELLKWLLPLDNSIPLPSRPLTPPTLSSSSSIRSTPPKTTASGSSSSQLFSFGNFRSYSMSSLPPNTTPPPAVTTPDAKPIFDPEDWNQFSFKKFVEIGNSGNEGLLSFRGVPLHQERFSVRCGLEGIFTPGRRWRRKIDIIQPVEIRSFSVDCNTEDLLCVHVKNVTPAHAPDVVVFIDAITIVFEEASRDGPPLFSPIACIEAGTDYSLPNLALRRGEEHSFILKPATTIWKHAKGHTESNLQSSRIPAGNAPSNWHQSSIVEGKHSGPPIDQYAVLVSCRCNYTESKLFFKKPTSWRPRISRDLMISVASETSRQSLGSDGTQIPVQVLTLQASNMTSDNLTLTVLAPASFTSPPSVVSLSNSPLSPLSPFAASPELAERLSSDRLSSVSLSQGQKLEDGIDEPPVPKADVVPNSDLGCTHLWLQSRVPLGCVPSQSTATIKLEVLPLTDGIITLDSLRIDVKERGVSYIPEQSLNIYATSSIATGII
ncbi:hypothetical protein BUALT_Bualt17G0061500 [Buddleja alternifolia]|uniref:Uncharacterized protein n=1 Tax=Buddleja alternifolia TaxID=168488 RepID=A0AAV6WH51_9LAMI|nr:hypothetical protein BUALT_Bualt17G0061500 [Buddleja alternifolia]